MLHFRAPLGLYHLSKEEQLELLGMNHSATHRPADHFRPPDSMSPLVGVAVSQDAADRARHFQVA